VKPDLNRVMQMADELVALGVSEEGVRSIRDWVRDRRAGKPTLIMFFGTYGSVGHNWWEPDREGRLRRPRERSSMDSVGPWGQVDGKLTPRDTNRQSTAVLHHLDGWTALAMHDYTVDKRGGSNAVFVMDSDLSFGQALTYIAEAMPAVVRRITTAALIDLVETCECTGGTAHDRRR
jgi:hypothetical protein